MKIDEYKKISDNVRVPDVDHISADHISICDPCIA